MPTKKQWKAVCERLGWFSHKVPFDSLIHGNQYTVQMYEGWIDWYTGEYAYGEYDCRWDSNTKRFISNEGEDYSFEFDDINDVWVEEK